MSFLIFFLRIIHQFWIPWAETIHYWYYCDKIRRTWLFVILITIILFIINYFKSFDHKENRKRRLKICIIFLCFKTLFWQFLLIFNCILPSNSIMYFSNNSLSNKLRLSLFESLDKLLLLGSMCPNYIRPWNMRSISIYDIKIVN